MAAAMSCTSCLVMMPPVGFCGEFRMMSLVRSVIRLCQLVDVEPEIALLAQRNRHRLRAQEVDHRLVNGEAGIGIDDLVALFHQRQHGEEDDRLAAGNDDHFIGR